MRRSLLAMQVSRVLCFCAEIAEVGESLQQLVVNAGFQIGQRPLQDEIENRVRVLGVEVQRIEFLPQAKFRLVLGYIRFVS